MVFAGNAGVYIILLFGMLIGGFIRGWWDKRKTNKEK